MRISSNKQSWTQLLPAWTRQHRKLVARTQISSVPPTIIPSTSLGRMFWAWPLWEVRSALTRVGIRKLDARITTTSTTPTADKIQQPTNLRLSLPIRRDLAVSPLNLQSSKETISFSPQLDPSFLLCRLRTLTLTLPIRIHLLNHRMRILTMRRLRYSCRC